MVCILNFLGIFDWQQGSESLFYTNHNSSFLGKGLFSPKHLATRYLKNIRVVSRGNDGKCLLCRQMIVFDINGVLLFL